VSLPDDTIYRRQNRKGLLLALSKPRESLTLVQLLTIADGVRRIARERSRFSVNELSRLEANSMMRNFTLICAVAATLLSPMQTFAAHGGTGRWHGSPESGSNGYRWRTTRREDPGRGIMCCLVCGGGGQVGSRSQPAGRSTAGPPISGSTCLGSELWLPWPIPVWPG
jgi:hypothetical protein